MHSLPLPRCATCGGALPVTGFDPMRPHVCAVDPEPSPEWTEARAVDVEHTSETRACAPSLDDGRQAFEDRQETLERAAVVAVILERCKEELSRLELVPHLGADEVNGLSSAKGFAARAEDVLKRGLGL